MRALLEREIEKDELFEEVENDVDFEEAKGESHQGLWSSQMAHIRFGRGSRRWSGDDEAVVLRYRKSSSKSSLWNPISIFSNRRARYHRLRFRSRQSR